jgi:SAM-dependent methyltransferase
MTEQGSADRWIGDLGSAAAWNGEAAGRWLALEEAMDRALEPFGAAALTRARAEPGERVLDVGCGCGATTIALARAVGEHGHALGIDISAPLLARARARGAGLPQLELCEGDAATAALPQDRTLLFSRFGLMFFRARRAAFHNLARALRPGGRLAFVCWRRFEENAFLHVPYLAVRDVIPDAPFPAADAPGPCALADREQLEQVLASAGFADVIIERFDHAVVLGHDAPSAVNFVMNSGPAGRALAGADETARTAVRDRLSLTLAREARSEGVALAGSAWVVTAGIPR